ncbi:hypothetical protein RQP53_22535 [Paucibacter sp. APW11]|uniref:Uncharacterized protein n=1 Tax=Roseateles aquae TaxID=3077235 RepID=A0ABU3PHS2_9BURK|nr:hypothetical protein [Paucibacter sp. APW11]MDT9002073.1 hypothetical protein [Paucibacter sp. APW11]
MSVIRPFQRPPQAAAAAPTERATPAPRPLLDRYFQAWFERAYRRWSSADRYARYY